MDPAFLTVFGNFIGFGVVVWLLIKQGEEAKADREWMKQTLTYLIRRDDPNFDTHALPGNPPDSSVSIPVQKPQDGP